MKPEVSDLKEIEHIPER